ncbi:energy-coupling factor ABC transporter substrate-binding protein [Rhodocyclus tenuis]|uniref:energy-coupling factor ABC transporter substrate-binding protein n=1 Tax=Rhodocyclus gracilis TaxID=2929842 RepID=UPI001298CDB0|nr:energy-coupling factor ABC transporter substrate-binding protein [Rhodocyclus gracilis]MRD73670.1 energy-coupling factor ABC transporter substrate-binding protein [Rhodocyclus gracilis]
MKHRQNLLLLIAVILLVALPLWLVPKPAADAEGKTAELFTGADDKARDLIGTIDPHYQPWFAPLLEPASNEISSLLFALQAALGAGFIGYYLGVSVTREKAARTAAANAKAETPSGAKRVSAAAAPADEVPIADARATGEPAARAD